ncbi:MAG: transglutaminaseTgpA domain-containing protein [Candidatus Hydrogenedentota bacterium]
MPRLRWESRSLRLATILIVLAGYLALVTVNDYGMGLLAVPLLLFALMPLGERLDRSYPVYRHITRALQIAYLFFIPYTYITLGQINALVALVIFIQAHTLLHVKTSRNYYHLYLMAFFLLLTAAVQAPEPEIGLVLLLFVVSSVWALAALRLEFETHQHAQASLALMPGGGENGLFTGSTEAAARRPDWHVGLSIAVLSVAVLLCNALLFVVTPRIEAGLFGRDESPDLRRTGLTDQVSLRGDAFIQQDRTAVMHVEFPDIETGFYGGRQYWRTTTHNEYRSGGWRRRALKDHLEPTAEATVTPFRRAKLRDGHSPPQELARAPVEGRRTVRQEIYMDSVPEQGLPCLDLVREVRIVGEPSGMRLSWDDHNDFTVLLETRGSRRLTYEVFSEVAEPKPDELRNASHDYELVLSQEDYDVLTQHDLEPATVSLAEEIMAGADTVYEKVEAVRQWLSSDTFLYTTDLPALSPIHPVDDFVTEVRRGHCELFGSALALMLRSQGIPARVVTGFRGGEWDESSGSYIVRASDAHLWPEVYFLGHGWVVVDPSPRVDPALYGMQRVMSTLSRIALDMKMFWYQNIIGYESGFEISRLREIALRLFGSGDRVETGSDTAEQRELVRGLSRRLPAMVLLGMALAAFVGLVVYLRRRTPHRRYTLTADQARAVRLYQYTLRKLDQRSAGSGAKTAEEVQEALEAGDGFTLAPAMNALRIYNDVRFGHRPLSREEYKNLVRQLKGRHMHSAAE